MFAAPEQYKRGLVCYSSDVYALALLYIYMVTGRPASADHVQRIRLPRVIREALADDPERRLDIDSFLSGLRDLIAEKEFYLVHSGRRIRLDPNKRRYVLGRDSSCDVVVDDEYVSRYHCELLYDELENAWKIHDSGSFNGTLIEREGRRIVVFIGRRAETSNYYRSLAREIGAGLTEG